MLQAAALRQNDRSLLAAPVAGGHEARPYENRRKRRPAPIHGWPGRPRC